MNPIEQTLQQALQAMLDLHAKKNPHLHRYLRERGWETRSIGMGISWFDPVIGGLVELPTAIVRQAQRDLEQSHNLNPA